MSRSCTVAASAARSRCATGAPSGRIVITIAVSARRRRAGLPGPANMTRARFERLVAEAVTLIPRRFRREMKNLALVVEDEPSDELLEEMEIEPPDSLYGLYQGTPLPERTWAFG